jgi:hypothetical protein
MNLSKGLRNSVTELVAICDEQINRWKMTREQLSMLTTNGNGNGHSNGHHMLAMAEAALEAHEEAPRLKRNGQPFKRGPYRNSKGLARTPRPYRKGVYGKARAMPDVEVPKGMATLAGRDAREAIALALKAANRPLPSMELAALLVAGGFTAPESAKRVPITRYVAQMAGSMAFHKNQVKKTAKGFELRA